MTDTNGQEGLGSLLERVRAATGPLPIRAALELWCLGQGALTDFEPLFTMDEFGNGEVTFQWDMRGGGRQKCSMLERDLPDRSVDAALALVERMLPAWCNSTGKDANDQCWAYIWSKKPAIAAPEGSAEGMPSRPIAILTALLSALQVTP